EFNQQRNKIIIEESSEAFKGMIEKAKPGPVTVLNDCQNNRWGGARENDSFEVNAAFENNT
ncbi:MAG: hypothetical protein JWQ78_1445, partial [Sediminibacterium sp.]|nr:hypothetical protein [Sediminibacterium sp.]